MLIPSILMWIVLIFKCLLDNTLRVLNYFLKDFSIRILLRLYSNRTDLAITLLKIRLKSPRKDPTSKVKSMCMVLKAGMARTLQLVRLGIKILWQIIITTQLGQICFRKTWQSAAMWLSWPTLAQNQTVLCLSPLMPSQSQSRDLSLSHL